MNRLFAPAVALLLTAAPLAAQEERTPQELTLEISRRLFAFDVATREREVRLLQQVHLLERLTRGARELAESAPATGRDAARRGLEEARAIAEKDLLLDRALFLALDRADAALDRTPLGESRGETAARFLAEVLPIERATADEIQRYLVDLQEFQKVTAKAAADTVERLGGGAHALQSLYAVHADALGARDAALP